MKITFESHSEKLIFSQPLIFAIHDKDAIEIIRAVAPMSANRMEDENKEWIRLRLLIDEAPVNQEITIKSRLRF